MKEQDIFVYNETNNFIGRNIFVNTKDKLTKELNILVGNAQNNFLRTEILVNTKGKYMWESNANATIKLLQIKIQLNIIGECMKESNTFEVNVIKNFLRENILLYIKGHIQESNTSASNATIKQLQKKILLSIKGQYMKESNILAGNTTNNFLSRVNTKRQCMKEIKTFAANANIRQLQ